MSRMTLVAFFSAVAASLLLVAPVSALTISGVSATANGGNTADVTNATTEFLSSTAVLGSGGSVANVLGNTVTAQTQYVLTNGSDAGGAATIGMSATSDYSMDFTVDGNGAEYSITIDTSRVGAFTLVDDGGSSKTASASMGAVTGASNLLGGVGSLDLGALAGVTSGTDQNVVFNQNGTITYFGLTGSTFVSLDFIWTSDTSSSPLEAAIRMGLAGSLAAMTADDYPGVGSRAIGTDGHFVGITAMVTAVPEPTTALLLSLGLIGLTVQGRRRAN
jgi:hypothetical protein